jgi:hypothetical protein
LIPLSNQACYEGEFLEFYTENKKETEWATRQTTSSKSVVSQKWFHSEKVKSELVVRAVYPNWVKPKHPGFALRIHSAERFPNS